MPATFSDPVWQKPKAAVAFQSAPSASGALDVVTPPAACEEVARKCGVRLELVEDAGHADYVEQPQAVAKLLRESLAG